MPDLGEITGGVGIFAFALGQKAHALNDKFFVPVSGSELSITLTEADAQVSIPLPFTWKNMRVKIIANSFAGVTQIRGRKNGADGNQTIDVGSGTSGEFEDTTNTDAIVNGDEINYSLKHFNAGGSTTWGSIASGYT